MTDHRRSRRREPPAHPKRQTTLVVAPPSAQPSTSFSLYQGNGVNTASELASTALPSQLVFDTSVPGTPLGAATTGSAATASVSPVFVGTANAKSVVASPTTTSDSQSSSTPTDASAPASSGSSSKGSSIPLAAIAVVAVMLGAILGLLLLLWHRRRTRRRSRSHGRASSEDNHGPPAGDILRKLGNYEKSDPFSDEHATQEADPFADPEKAAQNAHGRNGSESFLSMTAPRQPYTHAASASTGSSASGKARKKDMEEARKKDMMALNNLVRALDSKEKRAEESGQDRSSLPPVELFKAALVR